MQEIDDVMTVYHERGSRGLPLERVFRQLFNPQWYLRDSGSHAVLPTIVDDLAAIVSQEANFLTMYAEPPRPDKKLAAHGAEQRPFPTPLPLRGRA